MTTDYPIGPVMLDVAGLTLTEDEREILKHPNVGAVILFARNYESPEQLIQLVQNIRAARSNHILIAVDQEGGRVQRFRTGFTRLPAATHYIHAPHLAETAGWLMAAELLAHGVDFSFAPVLDVDCGISQVIGDRSFSTDCGQAIQLASAFRNGMKKAGMAATGKHFPGHGAVSADSHLALPVDERDLQTIMAKDVLPFKQLIHEGLEAVMLAHVVYAKVDSNPAGFSSFWIKQVLREQLGFNGVVFSDDLSMEGAAFAGGYPERAQMAQEAGCDMLVVCNNSDAAVQILESVPIDNNPIREQRLRTMQGKFTQNRSQLQQTNTWQQASSLITQLVNEYA